MKEWYLEILWKKTYWDLLWILQVFFIGVKSVRPLNLNPWKIWLCRRIILDGFWNVAWFGKNLIYKLSKTQRKWNQQKITIIKCGFQDCNIVKRISSRKNQTLEQNQLLQQQAADKSQSHSLQWPFVAARWEQRSSEDWYKGRYRKINSQELRV